MTAAKAIEAKIVAGGLKFDPGRVVMTPGAIELLANNNALVSEYLVRHITGDWGYMKLDPHDNRANESALKTGARIFSAYEFDDTKDRFWIITDAVDPEAGDHPLKRNVTTVLLPSEY